MSKVSNLCKYDQTFPKRILSVLLPPPSPQPRKQELDSTGTCDRGAQAGKTFENMLQGQPVRHPSSFYCPGHSNQLQFWGTQSQGTMFSASEVVSKPLITIRNKDQRALRLYGNIKNKNEDAGNSVSFFPLLTKTQL